MIHTVMSSSIAHASASNDQPDTRYTRRPQLEQYAAEALNRVPQTRQRRLSMPLF
jgi:hypothetical protein